jgi:transposase
LLGRQSPQDELFRPDHLYRDHVGRDSFYGFLASSRRALFRDEDFAGLYRTDRGRPSVPPSQLCVALLLQSRDGVSDEEAIQRTAYDLRWKVALGLNLEEKLCAKSTLQLFRSKLILHDAYQRLFQASIDSCRKSGLLRRKKLEIALDTTPIFGRGAVKDTFNLVSDQIRKVVQEIVALKGYDLEAVVAEHGLGRHFGASFKSQFELDWDDVEQKRALVGQLVADAQVALELAQAAVRGYRRGAEATRGLLEARDLLADLLLQDIEEEPPDAGGPRIRQGTRNDRVVSTTDPEMRHGRKSHSKTFDGYKASVAVETESGVIVATDARPGNTHDSQGAIELVQEASRRCDQKADRAIGDTAYGSIDTRRGFAKLGIEVVAKAPPVGRRSVEFTLDDFKINSKRGVATCPAGKKSIRRDRVKKPDGWRYVFSRKDCKVCPLRSKCTTARVSARMVTLTEHTKELQRHRRYQRTRAFAKIYRRRMVAEHRIARLAQLGIRQARYFGRARVAFQVNLAAAVGNLSLAASRGLPTIKDGLRTLGAALRGLLDCRVAIHSFRRSCDPDSLVRETALT